MPPHLLSGHWLALLQLVDHLVSRRQLPPDKIVMQAAAGVLMLGKAQEGAQLHVLDCVLPSSRPCAPGPRPPGRYLFAIAVLLAILTVAAAFHTFRHACLRFPLPSTVGLPPFRSGGPARSPRSTSRGPNAACYLL